MKTNREAVPYWSVMEGLPPRKLSSDSSIWPPSSADDAEVRVATSSEAANRSAGRTGPPIVAGPPTVSAGVGELLLLLSAAGEPREADVELSRSRKECVAAAGPTDRVAHPVSI